MAVAVLVTHDGTAMGSTKEQGASVSGVVLGATCGARDLPPAKLPRDGSQRSWRAIRSAATSPVSSSRTTSRLSGETLTSTALGGTRMSRTKAGRPRRSPSTLRHTSPMHRDTRGASMGLPLTKRNWRSPPPPLGPGASKPPARDMRPMTAKEQSSPPLRSKLTSSSDRANACPKSAEALSRSDLGACTAIAVRRVAPPPLTRVSRRRQPTATSACAWTVRSARLTCHFQRRARSARRTGAQSKSPRTVTVVPTLRACGVELLRIPSRWKLRRAPTASADVRVTTRTSPASLHDAHESLRQSTSREVSTVEIQFSCGPRPGWSKRDSPAMSRGDSQSSCGVRQARLRTSPDEGCRARPVQLMRSEAID